MVVGARQSFQTNNLVSRIRFCPKKQSLKANWKATLRKIIWRKVVLKNYEKSLKSNYDRVLFETFWSRFEFFHFFICLNVFHMNFTVDNLNMEIFREWKVKEKNWFSRFNQITGRIGFNIKISSCPEVFLRNTSS